MSILSLPMCPRAWLAVSGLVVCQIGLTMGVFSGSHDLDELGFGQPFGQPWIKLSADSGVRLRAINGPKHCPPAK
jgi:hypothetical protein